MTDSSGLAKEQQLRPLLPFYLLVDVSYSMKGSKIDAANQICPDVAMAVASNPLMQDKIRFGIVTFSDEASVVLPVCDLSTLTRLPIFAVEGSTSYKSAFEKMRSTIKSDVDMLKDDSFLVHRPVVFFVSDGVPTDGEHEWKSAYAELTDKESFDYYPNIIPFGVGEADSETIQYIVHPPERFQSYMQGRTASASDAIRKIAEIVVQSVLSSTKSISEGTDPIEGIQLGFESVLGNSGGAIVPNGDFL